MVHVAWIHHRGRVPFADFTQRHISRLLGECGSEQGRHGTRPGAPWMKGRTAPCHGRTPLGDGAQARVSEGFGPFED